MIVLVIESIHSADYLQSQDPLSGHSTLDVAGQAPHSAGSTSSSILHRSRGRPPGSKKKDYPSDGNCSGKGTKSGNKLKKSSSKQNKSLTLDSVSNNRTDIEIISAEKIVERINELKERSITENDTLVLENFRKWSKIKELDVGMKALIAVRDHLLQK